MIDIPPYAEAVWGEDVSEDADGTFSVKVWFFDQKITGLPSKQIALEIAWALSAAYDEGARNAQMD